MESGKLMFGNFIISIGKGKYSEILMFEDCYKFLIVFIVFYLNWVMLYSFFIF